jgi:hypothetical protein
MHELEKLNKMVFRILLKQGKEVANHIYLNSIIASISKSSDIELIELENQKIFNIGKRKIIFVEGNALYFENENVKNYITFSSRNAIKLEKKLEELLKNKKEEERARKVIEKIIKNKQHLLISKKVDIKVDKINYKMYKLVKDNEEFEEKIREDFLSLNINNYPDYLNKLKENYRNIQKNFNKIKGLHDTIDKEKLPPEIKGIFLKNYERLIIYIKQVESKLLNHSRKYLVVAGNFVENIFKK